MSPSHVNASVVAIGAAGLVLGVRLAAWPLVSVTVLPGIGKPPASAATDAPGQQDSFDAALVARDLFRLARRPAGVSYDPVRLAQAPAPRLPMPALALVGIVWDTSRDPSALVDGLPGVDGPRPMRLGDAIGGLRVKAIKPDAVVITGLDTTWTLKVREPWK